MDYTGNLIRPPSEANSIILQVTVGCPYNKCTFCGAYKNVEFCLKPAAAFEKALNFAAQYCRRQKRVFLADGDVLALRQSHLLELLRTVKTRLPWVQKISLYGSGRSIAGKKTNNLIELKKNGLDRIYMGLESGCDDVLKRVRKGCSAESMVTAGRMVRKADLFLSVTVLLGLGGVELSQQHAELTARALNTIQPSQVAALTLMVLEGTELAEEMGKKIFQLPDSDAMLRELHTLISLLKLKRAQFHANHASNYLPLAGRLPRDRVLFLTMIEDALDGRQKLVPERMRAL
ncbi:coproporphyrinogen III oxidase [Desulfomarina profundi]|uniref:Coproporphyrinogen III oxidase n=1 Tax=Desulfomarina profundi TaxID=2772557 RepID=A0A8D5FHM2_9BACT|nr:radical SAM protein [Desulfomarina profundi]BCL60781.1 coproporphyrinogen III oxidase [Desulfomarina profundi]